MEKPYDVKYQTGADCVYLGHVYASSEEEAQALADSLYSRAVEVEDASEAA